MIININQLVNTHKEEEEEEKKLMNLIHLSLTHNKE